jgi:hypothetical protein
MAAVERMGGNRGSSGKGGSRAVLIVHGECGKIFDAAFVTLT